MRMSSNNFRYSKLMHYKQRNIKRTHEIQFRTNNQLFNFISVSLKACWKHGPVRILNKFDFLFYLKLIYF